MLQHTDTMQNEHLTERELDSLAQKAAESTDKSLHPHIERCERCRSILDHLRSFYQEYVKADVDNSNPRVHDLLRDLYPDVVSLDVVHIAPQPGNVQPRENVMLLAAKGTATIGDEESVAGIFGSASDGVMLRVMNIPGQTAYRFFLLFRDAQPAPQLQVEIMEEEHEPKRIDVDPSGVGIFECDHSVNWHAVHIALLRSWFP